MVELVGMRLGRFAVLDHLNDPRQNDVYLVAPSPSGSPIAARIYTRGPRQDGAWVAGPLAEGDDQRFLARMRAIAQLAHPHLLPILDAGEQGDLLYAIVPAGLDGSLADVLQPAAGRPLPWPPAAVMSLMGPLAEALQYLHDQGITHGSVETWTVLVQRLPPAVGVPDSGGPLDPWRIALVLTDFGLGRFFDGSGVASPPSTIACAAPETAVSIVTPASDQYSLASITYWLVTGRPYESESLDGWQGQPATPLAAASPSDPVLPAAVDAVFARALQADPTKRFPRVADFAQALAAAWNTSDPVPSEPGARRRDVAPRPDGDQPISRRQAVVNIVGTVTVGLAAATGVAYTALAPRQRLPTTTGERYSPTPGDSIGFYRPTTNTFYLMSSLALQVADVVVTFGGPTGLPVVGDWTGNGVDGVGIFTPEAHTFQLLNHNRTPKLPAYTIVLGNVGDIPVAGDWTGSGHDSIGIFRRGVFYLKNTLDNKRPDFIFSLGAPGDIPVVGDWNGDGIDGVGVYRPSLDTFYLTDTVCDFCALAATYTVKLGVGAGLPLAGNWLGQEGRSGVGLFLPSAGMVVLKEDATQSGPPDFRVDFGKPGDLPVAGHWTR